MLLEICRIRDHRYRNRLAIGDSYRANVEKVASFLLEPHPKVPNMTLSRAEAKNVSAFIAEQLTQIAVVSQEVTNFSRSHETIQSHLPG